MKQLLLVILFHIYFGICSVNAEGPPSIGAVVADSAYDHARIELSFSGKQHTRVGHKVYLEIRITDTLLNDFNSVPVQIIYEANKSDKIITENKITDTLGYIYLKVGPFADVGKYTIQAIVLSDTGIIAQSEFTISVRQNNWFLMLIIGLLGGLSFFLYGMHLMSNGLQNSAGNKMRHILKKLTNNRLMAVGVGALITTVIQSSSATNVMLVSFVNSRLMHFRQTIGIILGAAIGTTITAQIIAFKLTDYALVFVSIGLAMHFISKKERFSEIARAILGFGILFYGMHIMSESMSPLRSFQPFIDIVISLENPILGILVGTFFTALIQSSSAFIGILIVLSMQGLLSFNASIALIIGANIGTAITAILASINTNREAKQVAIAHTFIKVVGAGMVLLILPWFIEVLNLFGSVGADNITSPRQIANAHTLYNILLFLVFIPFTKSLAALINKIFPVDDAVEEFSFSYINESLLSTPDIALSAARQELVKMMLEVKEMFRLSLVPFSSRSIDELDLISQKEERVNHWRDGLMEFLIKLSRGERSKEQVEETFYLLNAVKEFEQIADIISSQIYQKADSWCKSNYEFSESGQKEIEEYHKMTMSIIQKSIKVYKDFDSKKAQKLKDRYTAYRDEYFEFERHHYKRLKKNIEPTVSSSKTHLELITLYKVISSHATNTARTIIYQKQGKKKKN